MGEKDIDQMSVNELEAEKQAMQGKLDKLKQDVLNADDSEKVELNREIRIDERYLKDIEKLLAEKNASEEQVVEETNSELLQLKETWATSQIDSALSAAGIEWKLIDETWKANLDTVKEYLQYVVEHSTDQSSLVNFLNNESQWSGCWSTCVQIALTKLWYDCKGIDWLIWKETKAATKQFQEAYNKKHSGALKPDSHPWYETAKALLEELGTVQTHGNNGQDNGQNENINNNEQNENVDFVNVLNLKKCTNVNKKEFWLPNDKDIYTREWHKWYYYLDNEGKRIVFIPELPPYENIKWNEICCKQILKYENLDINNTNENREKEYPTLNHNCAQYLANLLARTCDKYGIKRRNSVCGYRNWKYYIQSNKCYIEIAQETFSEWRLFNGGEHLWNDLLMLELVNKINNDYFGRGWGEEDTFKIKNNNLYNSSDYLVKRNILKWYPTLNSNQLNIFTSQLNIQFNKRIKK